MIEIQGSVSKEQEHESMSEEDKKNFVMKKGVCMNGVTNTIWNAVNEEEEKFYLKTEMKLQAFLTKEGIVTKLKEMWGMQDVNHKLCGTFLS